MNVLGLVFSLLLILSYGYYAVIDKYAAGIKLRNTYLSHYQANRKVLNQFESQFYNHSLHPMKNLPHKEKTEEEQYAGEEINEKEPKLNRECARINLWPLIHEGREAHPLLYELAAKMIRTFYGPLNPGKKRFEYEFLDHLLASAKKSEQEGFSLEKVALSDPEMQRVYYKMLKGTKKWDLREEIGYPPFTEYVKAEPSQEKICIFHAHPDLLTVVFNPKIAWKLHGELHKEGGPVLTWELIERVASETHTFSLDSKLQELLDLKDYLNHKDQKKTFVADVGGVLLRKKLSSN